MLIWRRIYDPSPKWTIHNECRRYYTISDVLSAHYLLPSFQKAYLLLWQLSLIIPYYDTKVFPQIDSTKHKQYPDDGSRDSLRISIGSPAKFDDYETTRTSPLNGRQSIHSTSLNNFGIVYSLPRPHFDSTFITSVVKTATIPPLFSLYHVRCSFSYEPSIRKKHQ